ncbi:MAG: hypothetical protein Q8S33_10560 [Myxococcales bacterium]|nr:hypothetical protein [Myxococcales bacterium]
MRETNSQALGRRPSQVLQLVKDVTRIKPKLVSEDLGTRSERGGCFCLSAVLRRESSEFLFEGVEASGALEPPAV